MALTFSLLASAPPLLLLLLVALLASPPAPASALTYEYPHVDALTQNRQGKGKGLQTCIDDSDCKGIGQGAEYRCFSYICYPWEDDSAVPKSDRQIICRNNKDCPKDKECVRHYDKRNVHKGLCLENRHCEGRNLKDCSPGQGCCNEFCCDQKFFQKFKQIPCTGHSVCQNIGLGEYCCPGKNSNASGVCCDTNPNPPTTSSSVGGAGAIRAAAAQLLAAAVLAKIVL